MRKTYPCEHIHLTKNEIVFINGDVHLNVGCDTDIDYIDYEEFKKIDLFESDTLTKLVYDGFNGKSNPYAEILFEVNKENYACTGDSVWYKFVDHHWRSLQGYNTDLRLSIRSELKNMYIKVRDYYVDHDGKKSKTVKLINRVITNLDGTHLIDEIMQELTYLYMHNNEEFQKKLNVNCYLIGFNNGVYDLKSHTFRDGKRDDYISFTTGYDYNDEYSDNYNALMQFLEDIQPNKIDRDYLLTYVSTALIGNILELFTVLTGDGRNGKSKFVNLIEKVFGDYCDTISSTLLTSQLKEGDAPAPALLSLINKKIVFASESLEGAKLNTGFIKFITGRDSNRKRYCHQNEMIKFAPNFITFLVCNDIPECDKMDNAFSKRLRCINFPTIFVDDHERDPNNKNHKVKNKQINEQFDYWKQDFFLLLLEYYKKYEKITI